jgi:error-prone DNA polymerase
MAKQQITGPAADGIIRSITSFALYGFPESHAASFALLVYASAYLKAHYPSAFYTALLNNQPMGFYHPATLVKDAQRHGVRFAPIDVQESGWTCRVDRDGRVRLGLMYVNGLRQDVGRAIAGEATAGSDVRNAGAAADRGAGLATRDSDPCDTRENEPWSTDRCPKCGCDDRSMLEATLPDRYFCNICANEWGIPGSGFRVPGFRFGVRGSDQTAPRSVNPESGTRNLNPEPGTVNPEPRTVNPEPGTVNPEPGTRNLNPEPGTWNPEPGTVNPEPGTRNLNPEPGTRNPEPTRYSSLDHLIVSTKIRRDELATLADIGALNAFGFDRRSALWQVERAVRPSGELFAGTEENESRIPNPESRIPNPESPLHPMTPPERLMADYAGTSLTIGPHPLALRRAELALRGVLRASDLPRGRHGRRVRIAGAVITRQRPGTAKGFVFLTIEDETGIANVIVRPDLFTEQRTAIVGEPYLLIEGTLQIQEGVTSIKAERVIGLSGGGPEPQSHDFR